MKLFTKVGLTLSGLIFILLGGCESVITIVEQDRPLDAETVQALTESPWNVLKATGEFTALWQGCANGQEEPPDYEEGACQSNGHDDDGHDDEGHDDAHDDVTHGSKRPARNFYAQFNVQFKRNAKGNVIFSGVNEDKGVDFAGPVTWVKRGRKDNELFFGGEIIGGNVNRGCFLFSVQDNGEGKKADSDRLQYRLYGSEKTPCKIPDHFPKGYPIAVYDGNLKVH